jgi:hypothetical protein
MENKKSLNNETFINKKEDVSEDSLNKEYFVDENEISKLISNEYKPSLPIPKPVKEIGIKEEDLVESFDRPNLPPIKDFDELIIPKKEEEFISIDKSTVEQVEEIKTKEKEENLIESLDRISNLPRLEDLSEEQISQITTEALSKAKKIPYPPRESKQEEKDTKILEIDDPLVKNLHSLNKKQVEAKANLRKLEIDFKNNQSLENQEKLDKATEEYKESYYSYVKETYASAEKLNMKPNEILVMINSINSDIYNINKEVIKRVREENRQNKKDETL